MSWYCLGGFSAYLSVPSGRWWNHSGCSLQPRVVGRALDREVERDLDAELGGALRPALEVGDRAELGVDRVVAALLATPIAHGRPGSPRRGRRACCCGPCGSSGRSGGSAAGRRRRSRARRAAAACFSTPVEAAPRAREELVPGAEAGAHAVDLERQRLLERSRSRGGPGRARSRRTARGRAPASCFAVSGIFGSLERGQRVLEQRPVAARWSRARARPASSTTPSDSSPARSSWPAATLRRSSSRQVANASVQASIVNCQRALAVDRRSSPAQRTPSRVGVDPAHRRLAPAPRRPGRGSGRPRAGCRGRRGRRRRTTSTASPTQRLAG